MRHVQHLSVLHNIIDKHINKNIIMNTDDADDDDDDDYTIMVLCNHFYTFFFTCPTCFNDVSVWL